MGIKVSLGFLLAMAFVLIAAGCGGRTVRPCSEGGDPAREKAGKGKKQCEQQRDSSGRWVNEGHYWEWHINGQLAVEGDYKNGRKQGRWYEWDEKGKLISDQFFEDGVVVQKR